MTVTNYLRLSLSPFEDTMGSDELYDTQLTHSVTTRKLKAALSKNQLHNKVKGWHLSPKIHRVESSASLWQNPSNEKQFKRQ